MKEQLENIIHLHRGSVKNAVNDINEYFDTLKEIPQEIINYIRELIQIEALSTWDNTGRCGLIAMATGTGKSKLIVDYLHRTQRITGGKNLIIVPTEKLRDNNWKDEFTKWNGQEFYENDVETTCYASISKQINSSYTTIVCDEGHNLTENNSSFFEQNQYNNLMVLTATPPTDPTKVAILERLGIKTVYELDLDTAVKLRIVAAYEIVIVETELEHVNKTAMGGTKAKPFPITEQAMYKYLNQTINRAMFSGRQDGIKFALLKRMRFIYGLKSKQDAAEYILSLIPDSNRTIIFCGSIEQARALGQGSFHSKTTDQWLTKFNNKEINKLSCVNALNEGMNLVDVDDAIIVQLNSNEKNTVQRIGRCIRAREGHKAKIIILVCKGTKDEDWVKKAIVNLDENNIKRVKLSNLKVNIESI